MDIKPGKKLYFVKNLYFRVDPSIDGPEILLFDLSILLLSIVFPVIHSDVFLLL